MGIVLIWKFIGSVRDLNKTAVVASGTTASDWEVRVLEYIHFAKVNSMNNRL